MTFFDLLLAWNMGNARPEDLELIIPQDHENYDIIAFGLQEATWAQSSTLKEEEDVNSCYQQLVADFSKCLPKHVLV